MLDTLQSLLEVCTSAAPFAEETVWFKCIVGHVQ